MQTATKQLLIYTDGSSRGNPGKGGYGIVLIWGNQQKEISAGYRLTTNNRMELLAVIVAIETLKKRDMPIKVFTDSRYIVDAVTKGWLNTWVKTNFKGGKKNPDLWMRYYQLTKGLNIQFEWVKGHADNVYNNRCDVLATTAADGNNLLIDSGYEAGL
ncbi:MAG: ribonuclease HI [Chitinophagaceae bacterium]